MAKKLSTADILKAARAQAGQGGEAPAAAPEASPESAAASPAPAPQAATEQPAAATPAPAAPATPPTAGAPKSTKDILAAARAQSTGAAPAASASAAPKATPAKAPGGPAAAGGASSTKDILAAARAQSGGAAAPAAAKSTGDILAAARAQAGKGAAPAAAKPAGEKPAKAAAKPAAAAATAAPGTRPSVQEMLKAAREGRGAAPAAIAAVATAVKPAPAAPVIPQKPAPKKAAPADVEPRRGFLAGTAWALFGSPFRTAWTAFTATMGISGLATARFMMPNVLVEPPSKFKVGPPSDYPPASVATKWTAQYGVWVVHSEYNGKDLIYALQTVCTHLGCTPNWLEGERKFKCPCHGSGFYITGINFEGPAPRPLERMAIRLSEDGSIEVDKSRKFQQELGQWNDPASFVEVA
ncbi:MAG TPA: ubiquinol-cytochrome c reductase iron-sulfur subunit [Planctomycetaceae bacterium]|nr:ubiquinol-cytochrome c reductase iron-sulfur subunit [Planctomycetaceae bacterium]